MPTKFREKNSSKTLSLQVGLIDHGVIPMTELGQIKFVSIGQERKFYIYITYL